MQKTYIIRPKIQNKNCVPNHSPYIVTAIFVTKVKFLFMVLMIFGFYFHSSEPYMDFHIESYLTVATYSIDIIILSALINPSISVLQNKLFFLHFLMYFILF